MQYVKKEKEVVRAYTITSSEFVRDRGNYPEVTDCQAFNLFANNETAQKLAYLDLKNINDRKVVISTGKIIIIDKSDFMAKYQQRLPLDDERQFAMNRRDEHLYIKNDEPITAIRFNEKLYAKYGKLAYPLIEKALLVGKRKVRYGFFKRHTMMAQTGEQINIYGTRDYEDWYDIDEGKPAEEVAHERGYLLDGDWIVREKDGLKFMTDGDFKETYEEYHNDGNDF